MAKKNSNKIEKETRRLIEGISDLVKKKGDHYKFKTKKKKVIKKVKRTCVHWRVHKGEFQPALIQDPDCPGHWKCSICQESFPVKPLEGKDYEKAGQDLLKLVNQIQFWSVKLGGDAEDTKMFLSLKNNIPRFEKVAAEIVKQVNKRDAMERNRQKTEVLSQFDVYSGFNYRV